MLEVKTNKIQLRMDDNNLKFSFGKGDTEWNWTSEYRPKMECKEGTVYFDEALEIHHELVQNGIGKGIRSSFAGFEIEGKKVPYAFETYAWIEECTEDIFFEWIPICEEGLAVEKLFWPGELELEEKRKDWYTLLNMQQGVMIPNDWETELKDIPFDGFFETAGGYMPWFAQFKGGNGYIAICTTPWNAGYQAEHPQNGPYTHVSVRFEPSLGRMDYRRSVRYTLIEDGDYNDACKIYRQYVKEQGNLCTLNEKAARVPSVNDLIGCSFIHKGIKTFVQPESDFFDPENPEKNNNLTSFAVRTREMKELHELGAGKLYLHLDGWAEPGYDNNHPDYTPACEEAGGWKAMKELSDTMKEQGDLFGIHDQYRDYYFSAESFDEDYACRLPDGTIPTHKRWAGGQQSYLCATQAPHYVQRNFSELEKNQIHLDGAYLDVFTCNEGDECNNPRHRMTRRECYDYRARCFDYLMSKGILPSSEEVSDWSARSLVFCHYAPYDFMLRKPGSPKHGIPVPLFNLVYHDCLIEPWMMEKIDDTEDYMLYALLNGGAPYLIRDGAYPDFDGSFEGNVKMHIMEDIKRCLVWILMYDKDYGIINFLLNNAGILSHNIAYLQDVSVALPAAMVVNIWKGFPYVAIMLLAGMQSVSTDLYEAADIDGATTFQKIRYITIPAIRSVSTTVFLLLIIWTIKDYAIAYVLTKGGPSRATELLTIYIQQTGFKYFDFGKASAAGMLMLLVALAFTFFYFKVLNKEEE